MNSAIRGREREMAKRDSSEAVLDAPYTASKCAKSDTDSSIPSIETPALSSSSSVTNFSFVSPHVFMFMGGFNGRRARGLKAG